MDIKELQRKMHKTKEFLKGEFGKIRGSRANPQIIEDMEVEAYDSELPIKQLATVSAVGPTQITVQCWDKSNVNVVKKSIEEADLDVGLAIDGNIVRVQFPPLTEERREELVKIVKKILEDAKVSIRHIRREYLDSLEADGVSEDALERGRKKVQNLVDEYNESFDMEFEKKQKELLTI